VTIHCAEGPLHLTQQVKKYPQNLTLDMHSLYHSPQMLNSDISQKRTEYSNTHYKIFP